MEEKELNAELIQLIEDKVRALMAEKDENPDRAETLDERERLLRQRELRAETIEALAEKKLPAELADAISYADEETCHAGLLAGARISNGASEGGGRATARQCAERGQGGRPRDDGRSRLLSHEDRNVNELGGM